MTISTSPVIQTDHRGKAFGALLSAFLLVCLLISSKSAKYEAPHDHALDMGNFNDIDSNRQLWANEGCGPIEIFIATNGKKCETHWRERMLTTSTLPGYLYLSNADTKDWDGYDGFVSSTTVEFKKKGKQNVTVCFKQAEYISFLSFSSKSFGKVYAEKFKSYKDFDGTPNKRARGGVGTIHSHEWLQYKVDVTKTGKYTITYKLGRQASECNKIPDVPTPSTTKPVSPSPPPVAPTPAAPTPAKPTTAPTSAAPTGVRACDHKEKVSSSCECKSPRGKKQTGQNEFYCYDPCKDGENTQNCACFGTSAPPGFVKIEQGQICATVPACKQGEKIKSTENGPSCYCSEPLRHLSEAPDPTCVPLCKGAGEKQHDSKGQAVCVCPDNAPANNDDICFSGPTGPISDCTKVELSEILSPSNIKLCNCKAPNVTQSNTWSLLYQNGGSTLCAPSCATGAETIVDKKYTCICDQNRSVSNNKCINLLPCKENDPVGTFETGPLCDCSLSDTFKFAPFNGKCVAVKDCTDGQYIPGDGSTTAPCFCDEKKGGVSGPSITCGYPKTTCADGANYTDTNGTPICKCLTDDPTLGGQPTGTGPSSVLVCKYIPVCKVGGSTDGCYCKTYGDGGKCAVPK